MLSGRGRLALGERNTDHMNDKQTEAGRGKSAEKTTLRGFPGRPQSPSLALQRSRRWLPTALARGCLGLMMAEIGPENESGSPDSTLSASYVPSLCLMLGSENGVSTCVFLWRGPHPGIALKRVSV